jgi:hypothetical protein
VIGLSFSVTASQSLQRGRRRSFSDRPADWIARVAVPGDFGYTAGIERRVFGRADDDGRLFAEILTAPSGTEDGLWAVRLGPRAMPALEPGASWDGSAPAPTPLGAGRGAYLSDALIADVAVRVQAFHSADGGVSWVAATAAVDIDGPARAVALETEAWPLLPYAAAPGKAALLVPAEGSLAAADFVATATAAAPAPQDWTAAERRVIDGRDVWMLTGLPSAPGVVLETLSLIHATPAEKTAPAGASKTVALPRTPAAFDADQIALIDAKADGADRLTLRIAAMPDGGGLPISAVERQIAVAGDAWGATVSTPPETGDTTIATLSGVATAVRLRAINALGAGPWRSLDPVTPTAPAPAPDADAIAIAPSRTEAPEGGGVHFEPVMDGADSLEALAVAWGVDGVTTVSTAAQKAAAARTLLRHGLFTWTFSDDPAEDYSFDRLGLASYVSDKAGDMVGPWAAHAYVAPGAHVVRLTLRWRARLATGSTIVTIHPLFVGAGRAFDPAMQVAVVDPDGDFADLPVELAGVPGARRYADASDALDWMTSAADRCVMLRRGKTHYLNRKPSSVSPRNYVGAWGGGTDHAILRRGPSWELLGRKDVEAIADGSGTLTFSALSPLTANIPGRAVYVNGILRGTYDVATDTTSGGGYTFTGPADQPTGLIWDVDAPPAGARIQIFRTPINLSGESIFDVNYNNEDGGSMPGVVIRDVSLRGDYHPAAPGTFDGVDLTTFQHDIGLCLVGARNNIEDLTVFRCDGRGINSLVTGAPTPEGKDGRTAVMADCTSPWWYNYGAYTGGHYEFCVIGCAFVQASDAISSGLGSKSENKVGVPNYADHGPLRMPFNFRSALCRNVFASYNSWGADEDEGEQGSTQPVARLAQNSTEGQSYNFSENECYGGSNLGIGGGGGGNFQRPIQVMDDFLGEGNWLEYGAATTTGVGTPQYFRSRNNVFFVPDVAALSPSTAIRIYGPSSNGGSWALGGEVAQPEAYNDTIVVKGSRSARLQLGSPAVLQDAGVIGRRGEIVSCAAGQTQVIVPSSGTSGNAREPDYGFGSHFRVYRSLDGGATWEEVGQADDANRTVMSTSDRDVAGKTWTHPGDGTRAGWTLTLLKNPNRIRIDFVEARADGELVQTVYNPTIDAMGVGVGNDVTFYHNNLPAQITRPTPLIENVALVVDGAFTEIVEAEDGPYLDPAALTVEATGPFTGVWRPAPGSGLHRSASDGAVALADFSGALRGATPSCGAFEPAMDQSGWPAPAREPRVTAAWATPIPLDGDVLTSSDLAVTVADAGSPALRPADVARTVEVTRGGVALPPSTSYTLQTDDIVSGRVVWGHRSTGRITLAAPLRVVRNAAFTPQWIDNAGVAAVQLAFDDGRVLNESTPIHIAFRLRLNAVPTTTRRLFRTQDLELNMPASGRLVFNCGGASLNVAASQMGAGAEHSFLISAWPGGDGPGGATLRLIRDGNVIGTRVAAAALPLSLGVAVLGGLALNQPKLDFAMRQWFGLWLGGDPSYENFFDPNTHDARDVAGGDDLSLGVTGMRPLYLLNGLLGFNGPPGLPPLNLGDHQGIAPERTGTFL